MYYFMYIIMFLFYHLNLLQCNHYYDCNELFGSAEFISLIHLMDKICKNCKECSIFILIMVKLNSCLILYVLSKARLLLRCSLEFGFIDLKMRIEMSTFHILDNQMTRIYCHNLRIFRPTNIHYNCTKVVVRK